MQKNIAASKKYELYIKETVSCIKLQLLIVMLLFMIGLVIGVYDILNLNSIVFEIIRTILQPFEERQGFYLFISIFLHNVKATAVIVYSGIFFSIMPIVSSFMNGLVIGALPTIPGLSNSFSILEIFIRLAPHGIFEIPALAISLALGLNFGSWPFRKNRKDFIKRIFKDISLCYIKIIIPLLIIAALIETIGIESGRNLV